MSYAFAPHKVVPVLWALLCVAVNFCILGVSAAAELVLPKQIEISAGEWSPFLGAELPDYGLTARLISDVFAELDIAVEWVFMPWPRAMHDTAHGKYAATAVWLLTPDRAERFHYSSTVLEEQHVFFHLRQTPFRWQNLSDLKGMRVGGLHGFSYGHEFDQAVAAGHIQTALVGSNTQNFQRLALGRVDVVVEEMNVGYFLLRQRLPALAPQITHHPQPVLVTQSFLLFPKQLPISELLQQAFDRELAVFRQSGRIDSYRFTGN